MRQYLPIINAELGELSRHEMVHKIIGNNGERRLPCEESVVDERSGGYRNEEGSADGIACNFFAMEYAFTIPFYASKVVFCRTINSDSCFYWPDKIGNFGLCPARR